MKKILFLGLAALVLWADQLSKWVVTEMLLRSTLSEAGPPVSFPHWMLEAPERLPFAQILLLPFFNLTMVWNQGISFGLLHSDSNDGPLILSALSLIIVLFFLFWLRKSTSALQSTAIAMIIGGALGNVMDRLRFGAVIDFLDFYAGGIHFPAFNLADSCVCIGVFLLIIPSFFIENRTKDATTKPETHSGPPCNTTHDTGHTA